MCFVRTNVLSQIEIKSPGTDRPQSQRNPFSCYFRGICACFESPFFHGASIRWRDSKRDSSRGNWIHWRKMDESRLTVNCDISALAMWTNRRVVQWERIELPSTASNSLSRQPTCHCFCVSLSPVSVKNISHVVFYIIRKIRNLIATGRLRDSRTDFLLLL